MATVKYRAEKGNDFMPRVVGYVEEMPNVSKLVAGHTSVEVAENHAAALNEGKKVTVHESVSVFLQDYRGLDTKHDTVIIIH